MHINEEKTTLLCTKIKLTFRTLTKDRKLHSRKSIKTAAYFYKKKNKGDYYFKQDCPSHEYYTQNLRHNTIHFPFLSPTITSKRTRQKKQFKAQIFSQRNAIAMAATDFHLLESRSKYPCTRNCQ